MGNPDRTPSGRLPQAWNSEDFDGHKEENEMNARHAALFTSAAATGFLLLWTVAAPVARAAAPSAPDSLRSVMAQLGRDMQATSLAIVNEDWPAVARLAPKIANHPEPPLSQKVRILAWLGSNAGKFRGYDMQAHDAAQAMGAAAARSDGDAVIDAYARTQRACLGCHRNFRSDFISHFRGGRG